MCDKYQTNVKAIAIVICVIAVCMTFVNVNEDPRTKAMRMCSSGFKGGDASVLCAEAIFGTKSE